MDSGILQFDRINNGAELGFRILVLVFIFAFYHFVR